MISFLNNFIQDIKLLLRSESIRRSIAEIKECAISDTQSMILYGQTICKLVENVKDIPTMLFWIKMERYLNKLDEIPYEDRLNFSEKFADDENRELFVRRLLLIIDKSDHEQKIDIQANLTRALMLNKIDFDKYYRLMQAVNVTLYEDLLYLKNNVLLKDKEWCINIISLLQTGLAYQSVIDRGEDAKYSVSNLGKEVVYYGIEFDKMEDNRSLLAEINSVQKTIVVGRWG